MNLNRVVRGIVLTATFVVGIILAFQELRATFLGEEIDRVLNVQIGATDLHKTILEEGRVSGFLRARANFGLAALSFSLASTTKEEDEKIAQYCHALSYIDDALRDRPYDSRFLVSAANVQQLLGTAKCPQPGLRKNYQSILDFAVRQDPTNPQILYSAAQIYVWGGDKERALQTLRQVVTFDIAATPGQEAFIASVVREPGDLEKVLPHRFPQVATWSRILREQKKEGFSDFITVLGGAQIEAIGQSVKERKQGQIPSSVHLERLWSLYELESLGEEVRKTLDIATADFLGKRGEPFLASYLAERAKYDELPVLRGVLKDDTKPFRGVLSSWGSDNPQFFDEYYTSVGFFLPSNERIHAIEIHSKRGGESGVGGHIKVLVSDDNQKWRDESIGRIPQEFQIARSSVIIIPIPELSSKYWKIHFDSPKRIPSFGNSLDNLVKVYGMHD